MAFVTGWFFEWGHFLFADVDGVGASWVEGAAGRGICGAWDFALESEAFAA